MLVVMYLGLNVNQLVNYCLYLNLFLVSLYFVKLQRIVFYYIELALEMYP